jgi:poly-gamma-glutamate capsule biosynthesis protein CapA/YwtB (metallophosphatase superfamily)
MIGHFANRAQSPQALTLCFTGDLVLDVEGPDHWLGGIAPALRAADVAIGHLEVPHTRRGAELHGDVPAPGANPDHLDALPRAGISAVSLAGNHMADCGAEGIADTIDRLAALGLAHAGAGQTRDAARQPAVLARHHRRIALLSYNCVGPEAGWAQAQRAGCNYLPVQTADGGPVTPRAALVAIDPLAREWLAADIGAARSDAELVVVALHQGTVHTPGRIEPYERQLSDAAMESGADIVVCHHAHLLRGISRHAGRPVFHGLGNGCVVTTALGMEQSHPARAEWARRRRELFGFEPDPAYHLAPFHPEAVHAALGVVRWHANGTLDTGVIPVFVEAPGRPVCVSDARAEAVIAYLDRINAQAGLRPLQWRRESDLLWFCT